MCTYSSDCFFQCTISCIFQQRVSSAILLPIHQSSGVSEVTQASQFLTSHTNCMTSANFLSPYCSILFYIIHEYIKNTILRWTLRAPALNFLPWGKWTVYSNFLFSVYGQVSHPWQLFASHLVSLMLLTMFFVKSCFKIQINYIYLFFIINYFAGTLKEF